MRPNQSSSITKRELHLVDKYSGDLLVAALCRWQASGPSRELAGRCVGPTEAEWDSVAVDVGTDLDRHLGCEYPEVGSGDEVAEWGTDGFELSDDLGQPIVVWSGEIDAPVNPKVVGGVDVILSSVVKGKADCSADTVTAFGRGEVVVDGPEEGTEGTVHRCELGVGDGGGLVDALCGDLQGQTR